MSNILISDSINWNSDGEAYFLQDQHKIILDSGVPGDTIKAKILKKGIGTSFGKVIEIIEPSKYRSSEQLCGNSICSGCNLKSANYAFQAEWKKQQLSSLFDFPVEFISTKSVNYRSKIILPLKFNPVMQKYQAGLYLKNSHNLSVWRNPCAVCLPEISEIIQIVVNLLNEHFENFHQVLPINQIFVRGTLEFGFQCGLVFSDFNPEIEIFCNILKNSTTHIRSLFYEINSTIGNSVLIKEPIFITGQKTINLQINSKTYQTGPETFFQTNLTTTGQILDLMNKYLPVGNNLTVFDICSGVGVLSAGLQGEFRRFCFESNADSFKYISETNRLNSKFIQADMAKLDLSIYPNPDVIILDPPRKGVDSELLKKINLSRAKIIFYLSCNPQTQKKDLLCLDQYKLHSLTGFDMFPQTQHIESLAILIK